MKYITKFNFNEDGIESLLELPYGINWPVVYILVGKKRVYIGETSSAYNRMKQHKRNKKRKDMQNAFIIYDPKFNKSAILDIESLLINYMSTDRKYILQNIRFGMNRQYNYYEREEYLKKFDEIWKELKQMKLARHNNIFIENNDIFKFSPYKTLSEDQYITAIKIVGTIAKLKKENKKATFLIDGRPGTGKSVLAVFLTKFLSECKNNNDDLYDDLETESDNIDVFYILRVLIQYQSHLNIALVIPVDSFRNTLKKVFRKVNGLDSKMILKPYECVGKHYDVLIVDEAHRLHRRVALSSATQYNKFTSINKDLNINEGDELDWIIASSDYQILFYDANQSIRPSDIRNEKFTELKKSGALEYSLISQMRIKGGEYYVSCIDKLLDGSIRKPIRVKKYDLKIFDDVEEMYNSIRVKNDEFGLCRMVAGFAWSWKTQHESYNDIEKYNIYDINIENHYYIWNHRRSDWVNTENAINEIGSIHTVQGYDLNYAGVIIGPELKYDVDKKCITIDKDYYYDRKGKELIKNDEELFGYIINIYRVLLTRGILGTYIYICDKYLKNYFKKYIKG